MSNNKKMPKINCVSVRLKILDTGAIVRDRKNYGHGAALSDIKKIVKIDMPNDWNKYVVTYKISRRGKLLVVKDNWDSKCICAIKNKAQDDDDNYSSPACILPTDWIGYRVTRTMKVVEKGERECDVR